MSYDTWKTSPPDDDRYADRCEICGGDFALCHCDHAPEDSVCSECGRSDGHDAPNGTCSNGTRVRKDAA